MKAILEGLLKAEVAMREQQRRVWVHLVEVDGNLERVGDSNGWGISSWEILDGRACVMVLSSGILLGWWYSEFDENWFDLWVFQPSGRIRNLLVVQDVSGLFEG